VGIAWLDVVTGLTIGYKTMASWTWAFRALNLLGVEALVWLQENMDNWIEVYVTMLGNFNLKRLDISISFKIIVTPAPFLLLLMVLPLFPTQLNLLGFKWLGFPMTNLTIFFRKTGILLPFYPLIYEFLISSNQWKKEVSGNLFNHQNQLWTWIEGNSKEACELLQSIIN